MDLNSLKQVQKDEVKIKSFLKDLIATAKSIGKQVDIPYVELVALLEHAKENPDRYLEVKGLLEA